MIIVIMVDELFLQNENILFYLISFKESILNDSSILSHFNNEPTMWTKSNSEGRNYSLLTVDYLFKQSINYLNQIIG